MASPDLDAMIRQAAQEQGIDPALYRSLIMAESSGNANAVSPKGAMGYAQLMPATAAELGVDPSDPAQNLKGGAMYLRQMLERFKDPKLALAAYNAGPANVEKYNGIPPFAETQNYVSKVLGGNKMENTPTQQVYDDPMGSLSKGQRLMLAFGALKDAGMALQGGQEGTSFARTMQAINEQQDQSRKSRAAQSEIDRLNQFRALLGGAGGGVGGVVETPTAGSGSIAALQKRRSDLVASASLFPDQIETIKLNLAEIDAQIAAATLQQGQQEGQETTQKRTVPRLKFAMDFLNPDGSVDENGQPIYNPLAMSFLGRGMQELTRDPQYAFFKSSIKTIKNELAFENMTKLKKQGVTFGSLSEEEFNNVASLAGSLDPEDPIGTLMTLKEIDAIINKPEPESDTLPDGLPSGDPTPAPSRYQVGDIVDGADGKRFRFKGGDSTKQENWELVN